MEDPINLIPEDHVPFPRRSRPFFLFRRLFLPLAALTILGGILFSVKQEGTAPETAHPSFFSTFRRMVSPDKALTGENSDRINFLFLGVGGAGHEGPELTDTIIFSSVRPSSKEVGMLSIPRDLLVPMDGYGWKKINHINAYGEENKPGSGPALAAKTISDILDQPIHYWVKVDFSGFEKFIDAIGGVRLQVDRSFTDTTYPIDDADGTVTTLEFQEGWQTMDGATALKYVRSRHGDNGEGTDFARAARQQKVLLAIKKEVLSATTLLNPTRVSRLIDTLNTHIETNLTTWEILRLSNMADFFDADHISSAVLDTSPRSPLYETTANGAYVILPKGQDWNTVQNIAEHIFTAKDLLAASTVPTRGWRVEIQNATDVQGLAAYIAEMLSAQGFEIAAISNAPAPAAQTTVYDFTNGRAKNALQLLTERLDANTSLSASGWLRTHDPLPTEVRIAGKTSEPAHAEGIDFLIVLGDNSTSFVNR